MRMMAILFIELNDSNYSIGFRLAIVLTNGQCIVMVQDKGSPVPNNFWKYLLTELSLCLLSLS